MALSIQDSEEQKEPINPPGEEFATRLFSLVMLGVCATIPMMIIMGDW